MDDSPIIRIIPQGHAPLFHFDELSDEAAREMVEVNRLGYLSQWTQVFYGEPSLGTFCMAN